MEEAATDGESWRKAGEQATGDGGISSEEAGTHRVKGHQGVVRYTLLGFSLENLTSVGFAAKCRLASNGVKLRHDWKVKTKQSTWLNS